MTLAEFVPEKTDNKQQVLWKIGALKEQNVLDASWQDVADWMNTYYYPDDESMWRTKSTYRCIYNTTRDMLASLGVDMDTLLIGGMSTEDRMEEIKNLTKKLQIERQWLHDERVQYGRYLKNESRFLQKLDEIEQLMKETGEKKYVICDTPIECMEGHEMLILLSDWHIGLEYRNEFGQYDTEIAKQRINEFLQKALELQKVHHCSVCNVALLGDMGNYRNCWAVALENRENAIEQVVIAGEMIADFVAVLCENFTEVNFVSVDGNHSRLEQNKDNAIKDERLDNLIAWHVKSVLSHVKNFKPRMVVDNTAAELGICGKLYYFTHGDYDKATQKGISQLAFMLGEIPYAVCMGHLHVPCMTEINGVKAVQNGSLCGSGNDYTVQKRLSGKASQTILICSEDGIECEYPVLLEH